MLLLKAIFGPVRRAAGGPPADRAAPVGLCQRWAPLYLPPPPGWPRSRQRSVVVWVVSMGFRSSVIRSASPSPGPDICYESSALWRKAVVTVRYRLYGERFAFFFSFY